ncbi:MAG: nuclear transport factor 2 family protein [Novosphingobium sp.]|nr:nuclear transport factor 2 family protein [Novosphingobium sp.]
MAFTGPLEDRIAIRELHDTYADAGFRGDRQAWLDCWARDCTWITSFGERSGKEALAQQWDALWSTLDALGFFAIVGSIEVDGDTAVTRGYVREIAVMKDGPAQKIAGRYDDELVRENGAWKFASRRYSVLIREAGD